MRETVKVISATTERTGNLTNATFGAATNRRTARDPASKRA